MTPDHDKNSVDVFVARHAIFNRDLSLFAYELLFRSCGQNQCDRSDATATLQVLANTLLSAGLEKLTNNAPAFINFGRDLITSHWTSVFPPSSVVIEILESVDAGEDVIAACQELKNAGYLLALDDVDGSEREESLLAVANFVKVDFRITSKEEQLALAHKLKGRGKRLIAEKVETPEEFKWAYDAGYDLFQGFFFARPTLLKGRHVPVGKVNALRMIRELQRPELDFPKLENLIRCDVSLSYKLFRYVNSALFSRPREISSVKEALMIMGEIDVRRWMTLVTLPGLAAGKSNELIVHALVRARFCELLAERAHIPEAGDAFLLGLFSLLDVLMDRALPEVLAEMPLPPAIKQALLDPADAGPLARVYRVAVSYQTAEWSDVEREAATLSIPMDRIAGDYLDAVGWSTEMFAGISCEGPKDLRKGSQDSWQKMMALQAGPAKQPPEALPAGSRAPV